MATVARLTARYRFNNLNFNQLTRNYCSFKYRKNYFEPSIKCFYIISGSFVLISYLKWKNFATVHALNLRKVKDEVEKAVKLTARERRFIKFASVEFDGQLYMTPQDFLDSVVEQEPRPRLKRRTLNTTDVQQIKDNTPSLKQGSPILFRSLRDKEPQSGFEIAFNMFDTDGNQRVDKTEFLVIRDLIGGSMKKRELDDATRKALLRLVSTQAQAKHILKRSAIKKDFINDGNTSDVVNEMKNNKTLMEKIFSSSWKEKHKKAEKKEAGSEVRPDDQEDYVDDSEGLQRKHKVDTSLQVHFFGKKGNHDLHYEGFYKFMDNLQTEVLELEFNEFSKGKQQITEVDFAKILLRYTYLDTDEYDAYLDRLLDRIKDESGISFTEFRDFCRFLNNLEDFAIAMRMYTLADRSISKDEFSRAVKICTGYTLSKHLIETVFAIFDEDGDGLLSYKEFIAIMKDRLHRGFKSSAKSEGWDAFKHCLKNEMRITPL